MKKLWFDPCQISYDHNQLLFLLNHLNELEAGCYPEIENDLRIPGGGIGQVTKNCPGSRILYYPNQDALKIANELNTRLKMCGRDGQIVRARFRDKLTVFDCCVRFGLERWMIFHCTRLCLNFIEGPQRPRGRY